MVASGIGVSVISAAILEGNLILGLSDGSVINAGVAQGPMGLTGPQGPVGATGRPGRDGNTIHSVEGAPSYDLGTDGDFAINTVEWEVYGPKAGGQWGKGTPMIGGGGRNKREVNKGGDTRTEGGGGENRPPIISPDGDITPPTQYPGAKPIREGDFGLMETVRCTFTTGANGTRSGLTPTWCCRQVMPRQVVTTSTAASPMAAPVRRLQRPLTAKPLPTSSNTTTGFTTGSTVPRSLRTMSQQSTLISLSLA